MAESGAARAGRASGSTGRAPNTSPVSPAERRKRTGESRPDGSKARARLRLVRTDHHARTDRARSRADLILLAVPAVFLTALGVVMVLSAGSVSAAQGYDNNSFWYFQRQVVYALVGAATAVGVSRLPYRAWRVISVPLLCCAAVLMLVATHPSSGTALYGASRWIEIGPVSLQPSEFAKLGLICFAAGVLAVRRDQLDDPARLLLPLGPVVAVIAGLGILQRDLGTTLILCCSVFLVLFIAGVRLRFLAFTCLVGLVGVAWLVFGEPYRRTRFFDAWLNPQADSRGAGYQLIQGLIAIGSGGWTGVGLGGSRAKWDYLPNAHSDFIFAVIAEELGLVGALLVLIAFAVLLVAGVRIALRAPDAFGRLLASGIVAWLGLQTIINLGAVTGLLPITGVPLPLVSYGGTALVVTLVGIGVLASIARASSSAARRPVSERSAPGTGRLRGGA